MSNVQTPTPPTPGEKGNQETVTNPGKPNNDPDQTPEKEINNPPQAPDKTKKPNKIGFSNQFLLF